MGVYVCVGVWEVLSHFCKQSKLEDEKPLQFQNHNKGTQTHNFALGENTKLLHLTIFINILKNRSYFEAFPK